jgi:hypothetical protein
LFLLLLSRSFLDPSGHLKPSDTAGSPISTRADGAVSGATSIWFLPRPLPGTDISAVFLCSPSCTPHANHVARESMVCAGRRHRPRGHHGRYPALSWARCAREAGCWHRRVPGPEHFPNATHQHTDTRIGPRWLLDNRVSHPDFGKCPLFARGQGGRLTVFAANDSGSEDGLATLATRANTRRGTRR